MGDRRHDGAARLYAAIAGAGLLAAVAVLAIVEAPALIGFIVSAAGATGWCLWLDRRG